MRKKLCNSYSDRTVQRFYQVNSVTNNTNDSYDISDLLILPQNKKNCLVTPFCVLDLPFSQQRGLLVFYFLSRNVKFICKSLLFGYFKEKMEKCVL